VVGAVVDRALLVGAAAVVVGVARSVAVARAGADDAERGGTLLRVRVGGGVDAGVGGPEVVVRPTEPDPAPPAAGSPAEPTCADGGRT
jgi:hypothetical protein